jgi:acetyltransferase
MSTHPLEEILNPKSIAVVGASEDPNSQGNRFTKCLLDCGYQRKIYPVHPKATEVLGLKAYPSIRDIPDPVDYVISCIPASAVLGMLDDGSQNGVKCVHLFTGRFSETGRLEEAELEQEILNKARKTGIRLIGPNCLGLYYPRLGISFMGDLPRESGSAGLFSSSGGGSGFFVHLAALRGIRFSKVISGGNALDLNESDFLDYFSQDPETKIILMYLEGLKDGRRFVNSLKQAASVKPVIILKGGKGESGMRAAASHTAALGGSTQMWETAVTQAGAISAESFDELADLAVSFHFLPPVWGPRVGVTGGGGGHSVVGADECERGGLDVIPLPTEMREEFKSRGVPIWDWIGNPVDTSITGGSGLTGTDVLQMMARNQNFDLLIAIINEHAPAGREGIIAGHKTEVKGIIKVKKESTKPLLAVVSEKSTDTRNHSYWRWKDLSSVRTKLLAGNIPIYPTTERAAKAAGKLVDYYRKRRQQ